MLTWSLNSFAAAIAAELPRHVEEMAADAAATDARREVFAHALTAMGVRVLPSRAPFLLADFGRDMTETVARLREKRILVRTCASFGLPPRYLRLAVKTVEENERFLAALRQCW